MVQKFDGDWKELRIYKPLKEVDFHCEEPREIPYHKAMEQAEERALNSIVESYRDGLSYVLFTHGKSTSGRGKTTIRSVVRKLIGSPKVTPYVDRRKSIQHPSAFLVALKPNLDRDRS